MSDPFGWRLSLGAWLLAVALLAAVGVARAQTDAESSEPDVERQLPVARSVPDTAALNGKPLVRVVLRRSGETTDAVVNLRLVRLGERFSSSLVRRAMSEVLEGGGYAELTSEAELVDGGVLLRLLALPRAIVVEVRLTGVLVDFDTTQRVVGINEGDEITPKELPQLEARLVAFHAKRGFPQALVHSELLPTTESGKVVLRIVLTAGPPKLITRRRFIVDGKVHPQLPALLDLYAIAEGQRADEEWLAEADHSFQASLSRRGWYDAKVGHEVRDEGGATELLVNVAPGARFKVRIEGNRTFDEAVLLEALDLENVEQPTADLMANGVRAYYLDHGFLDVAVRVSERPGPVDVDRVLVVRENPPVRVVSRTFPCLSGRRLLEQANEEIDGVLSESLPGGDSWFGPVPPQALDQNLGTTGGQRATPYSADPWDSYVPEAYDKALAHLSDLYKAEGYLSAVVGPVSVLRRACDRLSEPGECQPVGVRVAPAAACPNADSPIPVEDPASDPSLTCAPDPVRGVYCEPNVVLSIPVKLGPRTTLWNLEFAGNERIVESKLAEAAALELGTPVSRVELQKARRRILDLYADEGYAFANVEVDLELSQDHTRGSARFVISERERVEITAIVVRGAEHTSESVILSRLELVPNGTYRRSAVRQSEEQLATLGIFSSVTISLEDPDVPAKQKVVIVSVVERLPQYVDIKPGFSTGEGVRAAFEYGHRNLGGKALQLRLRVQLGYLPGFLIFEDEVRNNFEALSFSDRLERRDTITLEVPVGKQYRLAFDGVDARDNSRDFGITKRALIVTLTHRPSRQVSVVAGSSFELNDARIFGDTQNLQQYLEAHPEQVRLLNVPEGRSFAVAVRAGAAWDRTDNPLGPTRGTFLSAEVEPVVAYLDDDSAAVQLETCQGAGNDPRTCEFKSRFLKITNRLAGYIPFTDDGLSLAVSVRWGANLQLVDNSSTYPDRLFFMGGADSLRGFLQASLIPQDIADQLQREDPNAANQADRLTARKVVIRGGDFLFNPRIELRIPLTKLLQTAVFLDTGNLWRDIGNIDLTRLRYSAGSGLRFVTPVGPLAFDYGFKLDRRFYESDLGAFHFSVGLF